MPSRLRDPDEYELLGRRSSADSNDDFHWNDADYESQSYAKTTHLHHQPRFPAWLSSLSPFRLKSRSRRSTAYSKKSGPWLRRGFLRRLILFFFALVGIVLALIMLTSIFRPSYTNPPAQYIELRERALSSTDSGRANVRNENVFIAANIIDEDLIRGAWGNAVLELIDLLGEKNVFLSVYENDSGPGTTAALRDFEKKIKCKSSIISEHLPLDEIPTIILPSGERRIKRVAYLAEVRNRALRPLDTGPTGATNAGSAANIAFDKILFLNDIIFSPLDAAQLLFSTNAEGNGGYRQAPYRAACAMDFINPFKFYDTFASRDLEGYSMGLPFFPFFSSAGNGESRQDVLNGIDAVKVRSCWGGMVAFEAKWFQNLEAPTDEEIEATYAQKIGGEDDRNLNWHWNGSAHLPAVVKRSNSLQSIRFRSESDVFWDASECCLIHADLQVPRVSSDLSENAGIFVNPFIRVAYDQRTFSWLRFTRRFERLYSVPHNMINHLVGLPWFNPRRAEIQGEEVEEKVWVYDDSNRQSDGKDGKGRSTGKTKGSYQVLKRTAGSGGFCGTRKLLVIKENRKEGEKMWENLPVPPI
ncbi:MAG: hypothetical protein M1827_006788 [Pycnora praestabilis]|nr:MAG: hypothetical protein M1827_006788 [Pycnora praestabilis]